MGGGENKKLKQKLVTLNSTNNITLNKEVESEKLKLLDDYKNHLQRKNKQSMVEETKSHSLLTNSNMEQTTTANDHEEQQKKAIV